MMTFGVLPGGLDPASTLSTYLSRDPRFSNDNRRGGWMLAALVARDDEKPQGSFTLARYGVTEASGLRESLLPLTTALMQATKQNKGS
jgi:hypothetical protein